MGHEHECDLGMRSFLISGAHLQACDPHLTKCSLHCSDDSARVQSLESSFSKKPLIMKNCSEDVQKHGTRLSTFC